MILLLLLEPGPKKIKKVPKKLTARIYGTSFIFLGPFSKGGPNKLIRAQKNKESLIFLGPFFKGGQKKLVRAQKN